MRTRFRYLLPALAAAAILILTACGDDDDGPTATPDDAATDAPTASGSVNPTSSARNQDGGLACSTITTEEAAIALDVTIDEVDVSDEGATCTYEAGDGSLVVEVSEEASDEAANEAVEEAAGDGEPVSVGTVGFQTDGTITASRFHYVVTYTLDPPDDAALLALGRSLGRLQAATPAP